MKIELKASHQFPKSEKGKVELIKKIIESITQGFLKMLNTTEEIGYELTIYGEEGKRETLSEEIVPEYTVREEEMRSLIDGCYEIVELFKAESPAQIAWKKKWLAKAREFGASGE